MPFILFLKLQKMNEWPRLHALQLNIPSRDSTYGFYVGNLPKRKSIQIYLTNYDDETKVEAGRQIARRLKHETDTVNGLKFVFTATCTYGTYVSVLSMCQEEDLKCYAHVEDSLLIFMYPNPIDPNATLLPEMPTL